MRSITINEYKRGAKLIFCRLDFVWNYFLTNKTGNKNSKINIFRKYAQSLDQSGKSRSQLFFHKALFSLCWAQLEQTLKQEKVSSRSKNLKVFFATTSNIVFFTKNSKWVNHVTIGPFLAFESSSSSAISSFHHTTGNAKTITQETDCQEANC